MKTGRLTKAVFEMEYAKCNIGTWCSKVKQIFRDVGLLEVYNEKRECDLVYCKNKLENNFSQLWAKELKKKSKLRLYCKLKDNLDTEPYVKLNLTTSQRSLLAQLRLGILPLRLETGRFTNMKISDRICQICQSNNIEDELHFLFSCDAYAQERHMFVQDLNNICHNTVNMGNVELLQFCCENVPRKLSKYICTIFEIRKEKQYR
jgi:hypothetical protein